MYYEYKHKVEHNFDPAKNIRPPTILEQLVGRANRSTVNTDVIYFYKKALNGGVDLDGNGHGHLGIVLHEENEWKHARRHLKIAIGLKATNAAECSQILESIENQLVKWKQQVDHLWNESAKRSILYD